MATQINTDKKTDEKMVEGSNILRRVEEEIKRDIMLSSPWADYGDWDDCEWHEYVDGN